jgi:hypothetical protein
MILKSFSRYNSINDSGHTEQESLNKYKEKVFFLNIKREGCSKTKHPSLFYMHHLFEQTSDYSLISFVKEFLHVLQHFLL